METFEIKLEVTVAIEARDAAEASRMLWDSQALSHYVNGEDVIVDVRELQEATLLS